MVVVDEGFKCTKIVSYMEVARGLQASEEAFFHCFKIVPKYGLFRKLLISERKGEGKS
ncbi:MAG: hypothetical protein RLZZ234_321 [Candidatus Parcubacteria bacterium]